ncbi:hypothetical protein WJX77_008829 [Trebouxia sp. C0004]
MAPSKWCSPQLMTSTQHTQPARDSAAIPPSPQLFDIDDFDLLEIRASASTLDGFIAGMTTQENAESSRAVHVIKKPDANKFRAYIVLQNKQVHLGYFPDEDQAARAVDVARIYMDKGMSNFPKEEYNLPDIKASASTFDDLVASLRLEARGAFSECFAANRRRAAKQQWQYDIWKYNGLWSACLYLHGPKKDLGFPPAGMVLQQLWTELSYSWDACDMISPHSWQNWYTANFPLDEYNVDKIRSFASTINESKHNSRLAAQ